MVALPDYFEKRMAMGKPKVEQIKRTGAQTVVAACENCRLQLGDLKDHYELNVQITALADLVVKAMKLPGTPVDVGEDAVPMPMPKAATVPVE